MSAPPAAAPAPAPAARAAALALTVTLATALSGCGLAPLAPAADTATTVAARPPAPAHASTPSPRPSPLAIAQATHEYPSPPVHQTTAGAFADPVGAVLAFTQTYINWNASTVSGDMRVLAGASIGQARSAMSLAAAQTAQDVQIQQGGVANSGRVEAIAPLAGAADRYVVVTLERTTATDSSAYQGLAPAWHVAVVTVSELGRGRWVVSGWQPES